MIFETHLALLCFAVAGVAVVIIQRPRITAAVRSRLARRRNIDRLGRY